jgi:hypothetical protein
LELDEHFAKLETLPYPVSILYDPVHLLKSIRNNWITEAHQELTFQPPGEEKPMLGRWSDIVQVYKDDASTVRTTNLSHQSCFPSPLERQKVSLVMNVINDKTVAALELNQKVETACILHHLNRLWKILNVRSGFSGQA